MTCGILAPEPRIEPMPTALERQSSNHWTTRKIPLKILKRRAAAPQRGGGARQGRATPGRQLPRPRSRSAPLPPPSRPQNVRGEAGSRSRGARWGPAGRPGSPGPASPRAPERGSAALAAPARPSAPENGGVGVRGAGQPGGRDGCDPFLPPLTGDSPAAPSPRHLTPWPRAPGRTRAPRRRRQGLRDPLPSVPLTEPGPAPREPGTPPPAAPRARPPRVPERKVPADGETPGAARRGDGDGVRGQPLPRGNLGPHTHLSSSAGALAALRGVSSAAGQGHAPDVSTQATHGWVIRGNGRGREAKRGRAVPGGA
uniref:Uncharacterized protein n=1 Tax=Rangifer tarandus platyrhynchus TaxID=3082113 RepID=A0ACB0EQR1_RANTA|nr:unnamed protein product [Rangifer tarandus platyrhynchus]